MMTPSWILDILAGVMLVVAAVSAARLALGRPWRGGLATLDVDVSHLLMGIAMAGMLTPGLTTLPDRVWAAVFAALTAWFAGRVVREARPGGLRILAAGDCHPPHLVHSAAMLYMYLAVAGPAAAGGGSAMGGMSGSSSGTMQTLRFPALALLFAFLLIGYAIRDLDQLPRPAVARRGRVAGLSLVPAGAPLAAAPALAGAEPAAAASAGARGSEAATAAPAHVAEPGPVASGRGGSPARAGAPDDSPGAAGRLLLSPWTVTGCRIAMGVTMTFMLIIMI